MQKAEEEEEAEAIHGKTMDKKQKEKARRETREKESQKVGKHKRRMQTPKPGRRYQRSEEEKGEFEGAGNSRAADIVAKEAYS